MFVQGLGQRINLPLEGSSGKRLKSAQKCSCDQADASDSYQISSAATIRLELLEKVRNKIKSGFYNSESVLDDLSQSFAKALDQTV